jgi:flagellar motor switch protein FliN/FliY
MTHEHMLSRVLAELPRAIGNVFETSASKRAGAVPIKDGFVVTLQATGAAAGEIRLYFERAGAAALARGPLPSALEPNDTVIEQRLRDVCHAIAGALPVRAGGAIGVTAVAATREIPDIAAGASIEVVVKGVEHVLRIGGVGDIVPAAPSDGAGMDESKALDVILDLDLPLVVRFGRTELPLKTLTTLGPGSVIDLGRAPDDPVEVLISNRVVARGEVVIVAGSYGVRVHDVVSPAERARSLEADFA